MQAESNVDQLLKLICFGNDISVQVEAASALRAFSSTSKDARWSLFNARAIPLLTSAIAESLRKPMQGKIAAALQANAMGTLVNIVGGMSAVIACMITKIRFSKPDAQLIDMIDVLAHALLDFDDTMMAAEVVDAVWIEQVLVQHLTPHAPQLVQQSTMQALINLYDNIVFQGCISNVETKRMLVGLITMVKLEVRADLIASLRYFCSSNTTLLQSFQGRDVVHLLVSLLNRSSQLRFEYVVVLLSILIAEIDANGWAMVTRTPPLVMQRSWASLEEQLAWEIATIGMNSLVPRLERVSTKTKSYVAFILLRLCTSRKDLRACVEMSIKLLLKTAEVKKRMLMLITTWCSHEDTTQPSLQDVIISLAHYGGDHMPRCEEVAYVTNEQDHRDHANLVDLDTHEANHGQHVEDHGAHVNLADHDQHDQDYGQHIDQVEDLELITDQPHEETLQSKDALAMIHRVKEENAVMIFASLNYDLMNKLTRIVLMEDLMHQPVVMVIPALLVDAMHGRNKNFPFDPGGWTADFDVSRAASILTEFPPSLGCILTVN